MPLPVVLPPIAWTALRVGALAAVAIYASRTRSQPKNAEREFLLDALPEGWEGGPHRAEAERGIGGQGRFRRVVRFGAKGKGLEIDASGLARLRFRKV